jgi:hypothetical protein
MPDDPYQLRTGEGSKAGGPKLVCVREKKERRLQVPSDLAGVGVAPRWTTGRRSAPPLR